MQDSCQENLKRALCRQGRADPHKIMVKVKLDRDHWGAGKKPG